MSLNYLPTAVALSRAWTAERRTGAGPAASLRAHNLALVLRQVGGEPAPSLPGRRRRRDRADPGHRLRPRRRAASPAGCSTEVEPGAPEPAPGGPAVGLALAAAGPGRARPGGQRRLPRRVRASTSPAPCATARSGTATSARPRPSQALADLAGLAAAARDAAAADGLRWPVPRSPCPGWSRRRRRAPARPTWAGATSTCRRAAAGRARGLPVTVDNEANLAALGELHARRRRRTELPLRLRRDRHRRRHRAGRRSCSGARAAGAASSAT